ncbi:MSCRAMM family protein [Bradyrhizobium sp. JR3.5]
MATYKYDPATGTYVLSDDLFSVTTDLSDYAPGSTASFTAWNVTPGGSIQFTVWHTIGAGPDGIWGTADDQLGTPLSGSTPWTVTDGGFGDLDGTVNGSITTSWYVNSDAANQSFLLTASDGTTGLLATTGFTDATQFIDLTFQDTQTVTSGSVSAIFSTSVTTVGAGTGLLDPFVRLSTNGDTEQGYNTDYNGAALLDNAAKGGTNFVHSLQLANLPIEFHNGVGYYRFELDINQLNSSDKILLSLDALQIWQAGVGDLHDYAPGATPAQGTGAFPAADNATLIYNLDAGGDKFIGLNGSLQSGSGNTADMSFLIPISSFDPNQAYVYLYSAFGYQPGTYDYSYADTNGTTHTGTSAWTTNDGFEEWDRQNGQVIDGYKFDDLNADHTWQTGTEPALNGWRVYLDLNNNGVLDSGEPSVLTGSIDLNGDGIAGNDANEVGYYRFFVTPGSYTIREVPQSGWTQSAPVGGDYVVTLAAGDVSHNNNFGNLQTASISGHKYEDADGNAATTGDETPVSGWTITIYNDANHNNSADPGEQVAQTTTDATGSYSFTGLLPGDYLIKEEDRSGWVHVTSAQINLDSVTSGQNLTNENFVNFKTFSISGTKYTDITGNGITADDTPLANVTIFIDKNKDGVFDAGDLSTTTAADGTWSFTGLDYTVAGDKVYEVLPSGYVETVGTAGYTIVGTSGHDQSGLDFANFKTFSISGTKYTDITGNGITADDTPLANVTIFIDKNKDGVFDAGDLSTTTAADGTWSFTGLDYTVAGDKVYEVLPSGYVETVGTAGYTIVGTSGHDQSGLDFANFKTFSISGTKYTDITGNGITADDTPLANVTIFIDKNKDGVFDAGDLSTTTAADGTWSFTGLDYTVAGDKVYEVLPSGYVETVGTAGYTIVGTSGHDQSGLDFANFKTFSISGTKYTDITGNGITADDTPLANVTIFIDKNKDGVFDAGDLSTTTAADGTWSFTGLDYTVAGDKVYEVLPSGYVETVGTAGYTIVGTSGHDQSGLDFANFKTFSISGTKYTDITGNGITADDTPLANVTIFIDKNKDGVFDAGDLSTATAADGTWSFTGLELHCCRRQSLRGSAVRLCGDGRHRRLHHCRHLGPRPERAGLRQLQDLQHLRHQVYRHHRQRHHR